MKVIDANPENCGWSIEVFCTGYGWDQEGKEPCGAKLEVADKDIRYRDHTDYSGSKDRYYGFCCCRCGCFTEIPENKIPYHVKHMAEKKPQYYNYRNKENDL